MSTHWHPDFLEEWNYEPKEGEPAFPGQGKPMGPARVTGRLARHFIKEPIKWMGEILPKAAKGEATLMDSVAGAMAAFNPRVGAGLGSGPSIKAMPWQSRTLDTILGHTPAGKKIPDSATPQVWASKLKNAGLPKEELEVVLPFLETASPGGKLNRQQLAAGVSDDTARSRYMAARNKLMKGGNTGADEEYFKGEMRRAVHEKNLPTLGVTRTELGGAEWVAGQKRLDELGDLIGEAKGRIQDRVGEMYSETGGAVPEEVYKADLEWNKRNLAYRKLIEEQSILAQDAVGKRPHWPQYNIEGVENPREVLYHAKPKSGEPEYLNSDMETHYGRDKGKNLLFHQREGELTLPDGKRSTHISEQQSDWHAEYAKKAKIGGMLTDEEINNNFIRQLNQPLTDITPQSRARFTYLSHLWQTAPDSEALANNSYELRQWALGKTDRLESSFIRDMDMGLTQWQVRRANTSATPEPPMKDTWHKMGFKDAVKRAVEAGHDYVTWDTADTQIKRWPAGEGSEKYFKKHYDESLVKLAAKEYWVKPEKIQFKKAGKEQIEFPSEEFGGESLVVPRDELGIRPGNSRRGEQPGRSYIFHPDYPNLADAEWNSFNSREDAVRFMDEMNHSGGPGEPREVWRIPITEEMKRKILLEGQYFSKAARPGGRNAESVA